MVSTPSVTTSTGKPDGTGIAAASGLLSKLTLTGIAETELCKLQVCPLDLSAESCKGEHPGLRVVLPCSNCTPSFRPGLTTEAALLKNEGLRAEERDLAGLEPAVSSPRDLLSLWGCAKASR